MPPPSVRQHAGPSLATSARVRPPTCRGWASGRDQPIGQGNVGLSQILQSSQQDPCLVLITLNARRPLGGIDFGPGDDTMHAIHLADADRAAAPFDRFTTVNR